MIELKDVFNFFSNKPNFENFLRMNTNFDVFCHGETLLMKIRTPRGKKIPRGRPVRCNGAVV